MKTHKKKSVASPSLLKFLKRTPAKKIPIELKPIKSKPRQVKFKSSTPSSVPSPDVPTKKILPPKKRPIPPPAPPLPRRDSELSPFMAPASLTSPDLDKKSPEFRLAHMRFYNELKLSFPMLNHKEAEDCFWWEKSQKATIADSKKTCSQATCARASRPTSWPTSEATTP